MNKRFVAVFAIVSILMALLAASSVAYRVYAADSAGRRAALADFDRLSALLGSAKSPSDLSNEALRANLSAHYKASPSLLLISVYERGVGVRWRIPAVSDYLPAIENVRPTPEPTYPAESVIRISSSLRSDPTGRLAVDALYQTIEQGRVFIAFRDALLALASYLALASIILVLAAASSRARARVAGGGMTASAAAGRDSAATREVEDFDFGAASTDFAAAEGSARFKAEGSTYGPPEEDFPIPEMTETAEGAGAFAVVEGVRSVSGGRTGGDEPVGLYSPDSGLGWERYLSERLDAELARSASFEQDLSLLLVSFAGLGDRSETYEAVAGTIRGFFSFRDLAFEWGRDGFAVVLPNMDVDHALRMAEEFLKKLSLLLLDTSQPLGGLPLYIGLSSRSGRLVDAERILLESNCAVEKARAELESHIVAFRPDPDKYRLYLASKGCA